MNKPILSGLYLILALLFVPAIQVAAQQENPMFYKEVILQHKAYTLHTLTRELQKQSGITFSYDAVKVDPGKKIKLKQDRMTVKALLSLIRQKTGVGYKVVSHTHIIYLPPGGKKAIRANKQKRPAGPGRSVTEPAEQDEEEDGHDAVRSSRPAGLPEGTEAAQIVVIGDSATAASYYFSGGGGGGGSYTGNNYSQAQRYPVLMTDDEGEDDARDEEAALGATYTPAGSRSDRSRFSLGNSGAVDFIGRHAFIVAGFSADELYYFNPTVKAGVDFLYGTLAYNIGKHAHWRYGIGASAKINSSWRLSLEINTGNTLRQDYGIVTYDTLSPPGPDTAAPVVVGKNTPLRVQSKLTRFTLSASWDMGNGFLLSAGVTFNRLRNIYTSNGDRVALSNILPIGYDADKKYKTIDPPYELGNTYNGNNPANIKTWIGLQLSLVYRIPFFDR